jgi:hypothetical protein
MGIGGRTGEPSFDGSLQPVSQHSAKSKYWDRATAFIDKITFLMANSFIFARVFSTGTTLTPFFAHSSALGADYPSNMK